MHDIDKFRVIYKLKSISRYATVDNRKESSAEHTWSSLILADYILTKVHLNIDRLKIYELLMYHDLMKIHAGDTPINPNIENQHKVEINQLQKEKQAFHKIITELPENLSKKYESIYTEYVESISEEAKFARAIEELDSSIQELDYKKDWIGFSEEFLRKKKTIWYKEFPIIMEIFEEFLKYCNENGFFNQK